MPQGLPHWPYVQAVDEALAERGVPPGTVRADCHGLEQGLGTYMRLTWDASRTSGRGGIRLHWEERTGWAYALLGLSPADVLFYSVLPTFRTVFATPQAVADVAENLVRRRQLPDVEYRTEWDGAQAVRAAARDFRRVRLGLPPVGRQETGGDGRTGSASAEGTGVQLTIDTHTDTYEQAIAAVQAAYGRNPTAVARLAGSRRADSPPGPGGPERRGPVGGLDGPDGV
ncbi:DUF6292 family protein [Streptomyces sp. V4I2]|uniref:DUF6292 family protein n=1 Tax=Streptomyces sp. V4I2 TaxID=3042280 RepID=UPI00278B84EF|nr:DUF6292 family protein [Streptomyces sp. V4I2]MDQ1042130.1 hypothetical protein [Streptomyces sp. V4I2]